VIESAFVSARRRGTAAALVLTAIVGTSTVWRLHPLVRGLDTAAIDETAGFYFEMAVNLAWCGRYPYLTSTVPQNTARINLSSLRVATVGARSVRSLVDRGTGSLAEYCRLQGGAYAIHESSIAIVESAILALSRRITVAGVAVVLRWFAIAGLLLFAFALVKLGWPILFVASVMATGTYMTVLLGSSALYSQYPLILSTALIGIALGGLCLAYGVHRRFGSFVAIAFALGVWAGFLGNLRTSQYPTAVFIASLFIAFGIADCRRTTSWSRRTVAALACGAVAALAAGVLVFDRIWIAPIRAVSNVNNYSHHVIAHPLVLGLATPPSPLAAREHIEWDDRTGLLEARKIDPQVAFLGRGYEGALFTYYRRLWVNHPGEMLDIYRQKLSVTRQHAEAFLSSRTSSPFWTQKEGRWLPIAAWPANRIASVVGVIGLFVGMFAIGCCRPRFMEIDEARGFVIAALAIAGLLGFVESAVVLSGVILWYSSVYLFALVFAGLTAYQGVLDACWLTFRSSSPSARLAPAVGIIDR
jgi:hypothetical protein